MVPEAGAALAGSAHARVKEKKMNRVALLLFLGVLLGSCVPYEATIIPDVGPYAKIYVMQTSLTPVPVTMVGRYGIIMVLGAVRVSSVDSSVSYALMVADAFWKEFPHGKVLALTIKADSQTTTLKPDQPLEKTNSNIMLGEDYETERVWFTVNKPLVERIASSASVSFDLKGEMGDISGVLTKDNMENFREFRDAYLR